MINWLMVLINKSLTTKIHHFSLDFGSALLANIIHAPTTLAYLSQDPKQAQKVWTIIKVVNVANASFTEINKHSSLHSDAFTHLFVIPLQIGIFQTPERKLQFRLEN
jgi:hypothetical protein